VGTVKVAVRDHVRDGALCPYVIQCAWRTLANRYGKDAAPGNAASSQLSFGRLADSGIRILFRHPIEAAAILTKDMHIAATQPHVTYASSLDPSQIQPLLDAAVKYGLLDQRVSAGDLLLKNVR
jgi:hypothetical protein